MLDVLHYNSQSVKPGIFVMSVWDPPPWKVHTNCYIVLQSDGKAVLIDSGRATHARLLAEVLGNLGRQLDDVNLLLATHHHQDHVGCSALTTAATRLIHPLDYDGLLPEQQLYFSASLEEISPEFEVIHLGWHTPGSIALFHHPSGVLFCGDHLGFYHYPEEGVVGLGREIRRRAYLRVQQWAADSHERDEDRLDVWLEGVRLLQAYPISALCPGHGGVLEGDIAAFLQELAAAGMSRQAVVPR